jgi:hypothetical protein
MGEIRKSGGGLLEERQAVLFIHNLTSEKLNYFWYSGMGIGADWRIGKSGNSKKN